MNRSNEPNCKASERRLRAYHDGELAPAEARLLEQHLERCEDCRVSLGEVRRISRTLRIALAPTGGASLPRADIVPRVLERTRKGRAEEAALIRSLQRVAAVAAVFLVGALLGFAWGTPGSGANGDSQAYAQDSVLTIVLTDPSWKEEF